MSLLPRGGARIAAALAPVDLTFTRYSKADRVMEVGRMSEGRRAWPQSTPETAHFWDGIRAGELRPQRCNSCDKVYFRRADHDRHFGTAADRSARDPAVSDAL
jgi:hypothetical protein